MRKIGRLIREGQERKEIARQQQPNKFNIDDPNIKKPKTLTEVGLTPHQSMDFQTIARMPDEAFEEEIRKAPVILIWDNGVCIVELWH